MIYFVGLMVFLASWLLTGGMRRYALSRMTLMDTPNDRSSHVVPTPRGGGVAIVLSFIGALVTLYGLGVIPINLLLAYLGGGGMVAVIGFLDDHGHIAARWRLLGHFVAASGLLYGLGGAPEIVLLGQGFDLGWVGVGLFVVGLVWLLNLYNFMDGIDGNASLEAVSVCLGAALLAILAGVSHLALLPMLLALAVAGFLYWNFPPAKIFMGDAGSGFIGIVLGGMVIQSGYVSTELLTGWLILLGVFVVDASFTLLRRLLRGERVYEAHRSHAYQVASRHHGSHLKVSIGVVLITLTWLLPLACAVVLGWISALPSLILGYLPLVALAVIYKAGVLEN